MRYSLLLLFSILIISQAGCQKNEPIVNGSERTELYLAVLEGKNVGVVANQSSLIGDTHLVDSLLSRGVLLKKIFAPEHGFRGSAAEGELVGDEIDPVSGLPVISLYGDHKKPGSGDLEGIDLLIFDLQDVGLRCYTYLSTLHLVMEACAENGVPLLVLDRPDPLGGMTDGPIMEDKYHSFVGMHPIPLVHGMTLGELARMINGEGWLDKGITCDLTVIPCENYTHEDTYILPVRPSPNLPNNHAVMLYPSLVLFEGTVVSVGRGTDMPFEVYGNPELPGDFTFIPERKNPNSRPFLLGQECRGEDLRTYTSPDNWKTINLEWLIKAYNEYPEKDQFFTPYFEKLAGTDNLRNQIIEGKTAQEIQASWKEGLSEFKSLRETYLLYP